MMPIINLIAAILMLLAAILAVINGKREYDKRKRDGPRKATEQFRITIYLGVLTIFFASIVWVSKTMPTETETAAVTSVKDVSRYGFESGDVFWVPQTYEDSQAVTEVSRSERGKAKYGQYSLRLNVDLESGHDNKGKGEAFVDLRFFPPDGTTAPVNLKGILITAWVFVEKNGGGDPSRPNGIQLVAKDESWRSEYSTWYNLFGYTDKWIPVRFTPSTEKPRDGYMDPGFDPTKIIWIGIKIGAGTDSTATYRGPIYVDSVDW